MSFLLSSGEERSEMLLNIARCCSPAGIAALLIGAPILIVIWSINKLRERLSRGKFETCEFDL
jgi:hypothetical protein